MTKLRLVLTPTLLGILMSCSGSPDPKIELEELAAELIALGEDDQKWEQWVMNGDPRIEEPGFYEEKDRLQVVRLARCREVFDQVGLPTAETVGREAASAFWVLVQHGDVDPSFQSRVLDAMRPAYERGEVDRAEFALLTDRVRINTDRPQIYGTQVRFDPDTGRIHPKPIEDVSQVDRLREDVCLEPLWEYVNSMTELHFRMNEALLRGKGIDEPPLVEPGHSQW